MLHVYLLTRVIGSSNIVNVEQIFATLTLGSFVLLLGAIYLPPYTVLPIIEAHTTTLEQLISSINPSFSFFSIFFYVVILIYQILRS